MPEYWIVGLDCAVDPRRVGIALGKLDESGLTIISVSLCSAKCMPSSMAADLVKSHFPALLAMDAPLGWPKAMGDILCSHHAGAQIMHHSNLFFRRRTDRFVKKVIGSQPLDVGADRIARTAWTGLHILHGVAALLNEPIPLAWEPTLAMGAEAIEVYPAATLRAYGLKSIAYKKPEQRPDRDAILNDLRRVLTLECEPELLLDNADALDAVVCVVAGADFLRGECLAPRNLTLAKREGWIWVRDPKKPRVPVSRRSTQSA